MVVIFYFFLHRILIPYSIENQNNNPDDPNPKKDHDWNRKKRTLRIKIGQKDEYMIRKKDNDQVEMGSYNFGIEEENLHYVLYHCLDQKTIWFKNWSSKDE